MAKLKDLAGLAALGAIGYKLSQKGKDDAGKMADSSSYAPSDARTKSSVMAADMSSPAQSAADDTSAGVLKAITAPKSASNDKAGNQGVLGGSTPPSKPKPKPKPQLKPRGMTGAQNTALANANRGMGKAATTAASDEGARLGNIKAAKDYNRGLEMEKQILNNMITNPPMKKGGMVKMASGGMTASRRGDGIATKGKTRGKIC
jgi:hypothetical protein